MSKQISGQIEKVVSRDGKFGAMFSIAVAGEYYGTGKNAMGASEGDWVTFTAEQNARGYWDVAKGTLKPVEAPAGRSAPSRQQSAGVSGDSRQESILFQSSRKDAIQFVALAQGAGLVEFGKAKGADKLAILETYVDKFTEHFFEEAKKNSPFPSQGNETASAAPANDLFDDEKVPF